jgi:hypothetical protein
LVIGPQVTNLPHKGGRNLSLVVELRYAE